MREGTYKNRKSAHDYINGTDEYINGTYEDRQGQRQYNSWASCCLRTPPHNHPQLRAVCNDIHTVAAGDVGRLSKTFLRWMEREVRGVLDGLQSILAAEFAANHRFFKVARLACRERERGREGQEEGRDIATKRRRRRRGMCVCVCVTEHHGREEGRRID